MGKVIYTVKSVGLQSAPRDGVEKEREEVGRSEVGEFVQSRGTDSNKKGIQTIRYQKRQGKCDLSVFDHAFSHFLHLLAS